MVNLKDTTFVIPVRIDSSERETNLDLVLACLCKDTNAEILIMEADTQSRYQVKENTNRIKYYFTEDTDYVFYRTRYLNELIKMATTSIVGIWDTDVIIPVQQIEEAVISIRQGTSRISYPYDGSFWHVDKKAVDNFRKKQDISILYHEINAATTGRPSFGGAFLVDKEIYLQAGGENENFYGWGPEDLERVKRMEILGYPAYRVKGPLFHLWHPRGINSGVGGMDLRRKNKKEFIKICGMYKSGLEEYISTWDCKGNTIYLSLMCRLGNLMFEIAAAASLAKKHNCNLVVIPSGYFAPEPDNCMLLEYIQQYEGNIFRKITFSDSYPERYKLYKEPYFHYTPIPFQEGMLLDGLFQSEKYFDKELVRELFKIDTETENYIRENYGALFKEETTSINIRRGDYLALPDSHPVCSLEYYNLAIDKIGREKQFLVCSDDILWCKENFKGDNFIFIEHIKPLIDLYIQTCCTNNIISNSTFGWWGAWLNPNPHKMVIAPKRWFGKNKAHLSTKDLLPEEWIKL